MELNIYYFTIFVLIAIWLYKKLFNGTDDIKSQGIAHEKPWPLVGNTLPVLTGKIGPFDNMERLCKKFRNEKIIGIYALGSEYAIVLNDADAIKQITIKDFDHFVNRERTHVDGSDKYLSKSLLMLKDQKWRDMRTTLTPIYTSSKMKMMYGILVDCAADFMDFYQEKAKANGQVTIDTHDTFARITADGISATALGFKGDSVRNVDSEIYKIADDLETDFTNPKSFLLTNIFPGICKLIGFQMFRKSIHDFFETTVLGEIKRRQTHNIYKPDVIQLLMQAREGNLKMESGDIDESNLSYTNSKAKKIVEWTDDDLVAQALVLFLGGFETTATLMQSISYELAQNPGVQQNLIEEIDEMLAKLDGKQITYDQLNQLKYLEMVINETLRKRPSFRGSVRHSTKDYVLKTDDGRSYNIKKGVDVAIPISSIHMHPKYFPNPEKFDPTRFSDENKKNIVQGSFLPFGSGPRTCVGSRFALLEAKLLLFFIMSKFTIEKCDGTPEKLTYVKGLTGYIEKIYVVLKLRN